MTSSNVIPGANTDTTLALDSATAPHELTPPATRLPQLWAQTHALRTLADFLDRLGQPGLALTVSDDRIDVQVPTDLGCQQRRIAAVAGLAAALGARPRRRLGRTVASAWLVADAHLAGHPVHVFTPLDGADDVEDNDNDEATT